MLTPAINTETGEHQIYYAISFVIVYDDWQVETVPFKESSCIDLPILMNYLVLLFPNILMSKPSFEGGEPNRIHF